MNRSTSRRPTIRSPSSVFLPPLGERASVSATEPDAAVEAAAEALAEELAPLADEAAELDRPEADESEAPAPRAESEEEGAKGDEDAYTSRLLEAKRRMRRRR